MSQSSTDDLARRNRRAYLAPGIAVLVMMAVFFGTIALWFGYQTQLGGCALNRVDARSCYGLVTDKYGMSVCSGHADIAKTVEYTITHGYTPR